MLFGESFGGYFGTGFELDGPIVSGYVLPSSRTDPLEFDLGDDSDFASILVLVTLGTSDEWIAAYADGAFRGRFAEWSSRSGGGVVDDPYHFLVRPREGWPPGESVVRVRGVDFHGNTTEGGVAVADDGAAPIVSVVTEPDEVAEFFVCDVSDASGFASLVLLVSLGQDTDWLVAYADGAFRGRFAQLSTRTGAGTLASPYRFTLRPSLGWPRGQTAIHPRVVDATGRPAIV